MTQFGTAIKKNETGHGPTKWSTVSMHGYVSFFKGNGLPQWYVDTRIALLAWHGKAARL